jgi:hypothetical protein
MSLKAVLGALALGIARVEIIEDPAQAELVRHRWTRPRRPRSLAFVFRSRHVHRIPPRVRDDREPPLFNRVRHAELKHLFARRVKRNIFAKRAGRTFGDLPVGPFLSASRFNTRRHSPMRRMTTVVCRA